MQSATLLILVLKKQDAFLRQSATKVRPVFTRLSRCARRCMLSHKSCSTIPKVVTEASKGVVMTGSGIAYFDLTAGEDAPITGTSEFLFVLLGVSGENY